VTIEILDGRYFAAMWYVLGGNIAGELGVDWMAAVFRDKDGPFRMVSRFRYYADDKAWGSEDRKSWYEGEASPDMPEAELVASVDKIADIIAKHYEGEIHKLILRTDSAETIGAALLREKWAHHREATSEDIAQHERGKEKASR